jgi:hypothetical protein
MKWDFLHRHGDGIVVCIIFLVILAFIFNYIPPSLIFSKTTTTGGDTAAHYYPAWYMKTYLLPHFKISGWAQGWYAGIPMFQFYFPFTFVLISLFSIVFSLEVAFKLMTFLAIIGIPIGAYFLFRLLKFPKQLALIASIFTVPHLFMEAQSMWGANIPSTFAGEFSYAFGICLSLIYLGLMYEGVNSHKHLLKNAILLGIIGVTHAYTLLWVVPSTLFLLYGKDFKRRFAYWFQVNAIAFLLISFWAVRWVYYSHYTTAYADKWAIGNWKEVFPKIFWPFSLLALVGIVYAIIQKEKRVFYLLFAAATGTVYYFFAYYIGGVDIRFIPFIQLMLLLVAAYSLTLLWRSKLRGLRFVPIVVLLLTLLWVQPKVSFIDDWAKWNYEGFEGKKVWPQYSAVQDFLKGTENDPRVVYENHERNNAAGTTRAFELLPYFSGRSTLEGLYMQSNPTSPFVFYIQSEISKQASCPFPDKKCTNFNLDKGLEHLKLFNVKHFIAITEDVKGALKNSTQAKLVFESQPYEVYELLSDDAGYVVVPRYKPLYFPRENWKKRSYELFPDNYDVPIIFDESIKEEPAIVRESLNQSCTVTSEVRQEEILFNTTCVGAPHVVRVSYFPRWKSENGEKIHLVSPSFMLIYPEKEQTRLYFGRTWVENTTLLMSLIGWTIVFSYRPLLKRFGKSSSKIVRKRK